VTILIKHLRWRPPVNLKIACLLALLTKLKVRIPEPITLSEGDAFIDISSEDCSMYTVVRSGIAKIGAFYER